jgi:hypothetical protein
MYGPARRCVCSKHAYRVDGMGSGGGAPRHARAKEDHARAHDDERLCEEVALWVRDVEHAAHFAREVPAGSNRLLADTGCSPRCTA